ncbi:MAG: hypothetical protein V1720_00490 [bacterium]
MKSKNVLFQPLLITVTVIILLLISSLIKIDLQFWGLQLKPVDILSDLRVNAYDELYKQYEEDDFFKNEDYEREKKDDSSLLTYPENIQITNAGFFGSRETIDLTFMSNVSTETNKDNLYTDSKLQPKFEPITGNRSELKSLFNALKSAKNRKVRIAYFGDSIIEGDLITADFRQILQKEFGGKGAGYLAMTSQDIQFRRSTKHSFSDNWEVASIFGGNPNKLDVGVSGEVFVPKSSAWVQYETTQYYKDLKNFDLVRLFYTNAKSGSVGYSFDGGAKQSEKLKIGEGLKESSLRPKGTASSVRIEIPVATGANYYGVSLENGNGVYVDNFPLRGNSGVDIQNIPIGQLKQFQKLMDYKLVILEFGLNALGSLKRGTEWYEKEMIKVINHIKAAFPDCGILLIGVHDKSTKKGSEFITDPTVIDLLKAQMNIAKQANIAFWNLNEAMGGINSMPKWVTANPPLAHKDYIHFNDQGAKKVADLLAQAILEEYKRAK